MLKTNVCVVAEEKKVALLLCVCVRVCARGRARVHACVCVLQTMELLCKM